MALFHPLLWLSDIPVYICTASLSIHLSINNLGCLYVLAIVNSAAMNIGVLLSFKIAVLSSYLPRSGISGSYGNPFLSFLKNLHDVFHSVCSRLLS